MEFEIIDPHIIQVAKRNSEDTDYKYMVNFIKNKFPIQSSDKQSELLELEGLYETLSWHDTTFEEVFLKNFKEFLVPQL